MASIRSFRRPTNGLIGAVLALASAAVFAAPDARVAELAAQHRQPLLDSLSQLCAIESGSRDIEGLDKLANLVVERLRALGGEVELIEPGCGACVNAGPGVSERPDQVTVSSINRNFPGRSGPGKVWLGSPSTVAASAIAGRIVSFEQLRALGAVA